MTPEETYRAMSSPTSLADTGMALLKHFTQGEVLLDRERSIIAQNAGTTAANIVGAAAGLGLIEASTIDELLETFDNVRTAVFNGTLAFAGAESVVESFEGGGSPEPARRSAPSGGGATSGGGRPHADVEIKVGKYRGKTIGQVFDSGADGVSWLEWASETLNNDWLKGRIGEFLAAA